MGRAPRDFSAPKRAAGCSPFAWGRAPQHSGCAPCRWGRTRGIRGLPPAIFPLPRTVFPSPRAVGVRPEAFFGAQKPLGARLKRRKILQIRQKTGFLPFFTMKITKRDSGDPEMYFDNPNLRWDSQSYLLEPGAPGFLRLWSGHNLWQFPQLREQTFVFAFDGGFRVARWLLAV